MSVQLTESFLAEIAGWEAMKQARSYLASGQVLSSNWTPPLLKGVVHAGETSFRAGLVIRSPVDIENLCTCRASRERGVLCAHSVSVGLHSLQLPAAPPTKKPAPIVHPRRIGRSSDGQDAEIYIILPPNLQAAVERGKFMLCFEVERDGKRTPLNALPSDQAFHFSDCDAAILDVLEQISPTETPALLQLDGKAFASLLSRLVGHPRVTLGRARPMPVSSTPFPVPLRAELQPAGEIVLRPKAGRPALPPIIAGETTQWIVSPEQIQPLGLPPQFSGALRAPVVVPREQVPSFLTRDWPLLAGQPGMESNFTPEEFLFEPQRPNFHLSLFGGLAQLQGLLQCSYGRRIMTLGVTAPAESSWLPDENNPRRYSTRDPASEQAALLRLSRSGFTGPDAQGRLQLNGQDRVLTFFAREYPRLEKEWTITLEDRLQKSAEKNIERIEPRFEVTSSGIQWFDLSVSFTTTSGERFSPAEVQRLLLSGQSHTRTKSGKFALIESGAVEELQEVLLDCSPQQQSGGHYRIQQTQAAFLAATVDEHGWHARAPADWQDQARRKSGSAQVACPPLGPLDSVLRPYQKGGVGWLHFLRSNNFGGILADEMGLGKTLQALAFLQSIQSERAGPALVICPTSLVFNWVAEAQKFTPALRVLPLHGPARHARFAEMPDADIVVTSYALVRRDAERYRGFEFDTVILDEAQHIKNRQTQNAQAVKLVRSQHRLVLTGTPLENSVLDLWSIFDFLMPGYLGSAADFRERYEAPLLREKNSAAQARLSRRLRPFLLRRLKRDVAADLPPRLEQVSFCEMSTDQRALYRQILEASRREVFDSVGAQGLAKSRMIVLTALLRLRQICCDLRLLKLPEPAPATAPAETEVIPTSGKLDLFSELLEEIIDGGHRVLVFSQFTSMLALLREQLDATGIRYCYLDGSTSNRGEVVGRFQNDSAIPAFLISLKAGGVGLNLTGADTVIHFDPWWNPAVEDHATDRAHRIGQTRVVTSYKLITRDSVEEKILHLQTRKREIIRATLTGEEQLSESMTWEEIQELFR